ncbi:Chloride transport protein 6 (Chloride channel protein 6) (ClC-6), partial [Durusdinium trenchii]
MNNHMNESWSPISGKPGTYALIGACAMLAGTARITISLAMILMETMGEAEFGLPIFLAVMVAKLTGDLFNRGIYDLHIVELKHVPFLETLPEGEMIELQVRDVMQRNVETLELVVKVSRLVQVLSDTTHHAFP